MGELSRQSSREPTALQQDVDTTSLTLFPDPSTPTSAKAKALRTGSKSQTDHLQSLLGGDGPSFFDDQQAVVATDPQALSGAPSHVIQGAINQYGAVELVRRLSSLLADRDAHVTALTRLAEEYNAPKERISETKVRIKQAEQRRRSLVAASEDLLAPRDAASISSTSETTVAESTLSAGSGTLRGLTRLFGGTGKRPSAHSIPAAQPSRPPSRPPSVASRSESQQPKRRNRLQSIDTASVESSGWTASLFSVGSGPKKPEAKPPVELNTRHDPEQLPPTLVRHATDDPHEAEWNKFIIRLAERRQQLGETAESNTMIGAAYFGTEGSVGRQKLEKLTKLVVGGIPMHLRHPLWMELSNTYPLMTPEAYEHYLSQREGGDTSQIDAILKDIPRTLTDSYDFYTNKGFERLKRVLIAFVGKYFELGYTQGLNYIAGYLLLAIPAEEEAFWVLCNMVDNIFPVNYFAPKTSMCGALADNIVLRQYIEELLPQLAKHLKVLEILPDHTVNPGWWLTALANMLPPKALLRVWDVMLCLPHQKTFIFNVVLAILAQDQERLLECETDSEYWSFKYDVSEEPAKIDKLVKQAFLLGKKLEKVSERRQVEVKKVIEQRVKSRQALELRDSEATPSRPLGQSLRKSASTEALYPEDERSP